MAPAKRYWHIFREPPSGRERKRLLNRSASCGLCGKPLGAERQLFRAYTGHFEFELLAAHPGCPDEYRREKQAQDAADDERRRAFSARLAAEARVRSSLIVVDFAAPRIWPA